MRKKTAAIRLWRRLVAAALAATAAVAAPVLAESFLFNGGAPDGRLAALSQPSASTTLETETADDFLLPETSVIRQATITGLIPNGTPLSSIRNVEIELYHVFPKDSANNAPHSVPSRMNSPSDVEIDGATRDGDAGTLTFEATVLNPNFAVQKTVVNGINKAPANVTGGDGPASGQEVQITVVFNPPIVLPAEHYFFRPEVEVLGGDFLYLSAPKPIVAPGTPFLPDLQAWIRNSALKPDWLRIGTDIIAGDTNPTFNMAFTLAGDTIPDAGVPGTAACEGLTVSALAHQFSGFDRAAQDLGFSSVASLQDGVRAFCRQ
ncbi:MAG TPA: hypothetical protein VL309_10870 [Vicinamibacterales bacterium]|nr:hypothetical protein [Vicinamibacterales bacterium]